MSWATLLILVVGRTSSLATVGVGQPADFRRIEVFFTARRDFRVGESLLCTIDSAGQPRTRVMFRGTCRTRDSTHFDLPVSTLKGPLFAHFQYAFHQESIIIFDPRRDSGLSIVKTFHLLCFGAGVRRRDCFFARYVDVSGSLDEIRPKGLDLPKSILEDAGLREPRGRTLDFVFGDRVERVRRLSELPGACKRAGRGLSRIDIAIGSIARYMPDQPPRRVCMAFLFSDGIFDPPPSGPKSTIPEHRKYKERPFTPDFAAGGREFCALRESLYASSLNIWERGLFLLLVPVLVSDHDDSSDPFRNCMNWADGLWKPLLSYNYPPLIRALEQPGQDVFPCSAFDVKTALAEAKGILARLEQNCFMIDSLSLSGRDLMLHCQELASSCTLRLLSGNATYGPYLPNGNAIVVSKFSELLHDMSEDGVEVLRGSSSNIDCQFDVEYSIAKTPAATSRGNTVRWSFGHTRKDEELLSTVFTCVDGQNQAGFSEFRMHSAGLFECRDPTLRKSVPIDFLKSLGMSLVHSAGRYAVRVEEGLLLWIGQAALILLTLSLVSLGLSIVALEWHLYLRVEELLVGNVAATGKAKKMTLDWTRRAASAFGTIGVGAILSVLPWDQPWVQLIQWVAVPTSIVVLVLDLATKNVRQVSIVKLGVRLPVLAALTLLVSILLIKPADVVGWYITSSRGLSVVLSLLPFLATVALPVVITLLRGARE